MFLPLSDSPNPQRVPWVTYALIAVNVLVYVTCNLPLGQQPVRLDDPRLIEYVRTLRESLPSGVDLRRVLAGITAFDLFVFDHGFRPAAPQAIDLFTSMFLHAGFMHLFGNMLFLWIYGDNVEYRLGWLRYLLAYLGTGLAATLAFALLSPGSKLPMIGASGAISGILGLYFIWFPRNVVRMLVLLVPVFMNVIEIPARIVLGFYLILDNLLPLLVTGSGGGGVAYGAHIGGFVAGLALAWGVNWWSEARTPAGYRMAGDDESAPSVTQAIIDGDMAGAAQRYFALGRNQRKQAQDLSAEHSLRLADWLAETGQLQAALAVYLRQLRDDPAGPFAAQAYVGAGLVLLSAGQVATAYQYLRRGLDLDLPADVAEKARAALRTIADRQKYPMRRFSRG